MAVTVDAINKQHPLLCTMVKLQELYIAEAKVASQSGAEALQVFFRSIDEDPDALQDFIDVLAHHGGAVDTIGVPMMYFSVKPQGTSYVVTVISETEDVRALTLGEPAPNSVVDIDADSAIETKTVFSLPAQAAIHVAVANPDDLYETTQYVLREAGGFLCRVTKVFGDTPEYKQQMRELHRNDA